MEKWLDRYEDFLKDVNAINELEGIPAIYHRVRWILYGSNGNRDPRTVNEMNVGSCSGKRILL